jgi:hypothetical protein
VDFLIDPVRKESIRKSRNSGFPDKYFSGKKRLCLKLNINQRKAYNSRLGDASHAKKSRSHTSLLEIALFLRQWGGVSRGSGRHGLR